jgi:diguanylate cyclase (GGDEF)-like protein
VTLSESTGEGPQGRGDAHVQPRGDRLLSDLVVTLRRCTSEHAALAALGTSLHRHLDAAAALAWTVDRAGQWRLVDLVGNERDIGASLAAAAEPSSDGDPVTVDETAVELVVTSFEGEPVGAMRLERPQALGELARPAELLAAVAGVAGSVVDRLRVEEHFHLVQRTARIGVWQWGIAADEASLSAQMYTTLGVDPSRYEHTVEGFMARVHPEDRDEVRVAVRAALDDGGVFHVVHRVVTDRGEVRWIESRAEAVRDEDGAVARLSGTSQDITGRRVLEQQLADRIERDELTGLPNRLRFQRQLQQVLAEARPADEVLVALLDVDRFQQVNDHLGWAAGDHLLQELAARLRRAVPEAEMIARLGNDEFAVLALPGRQQVDPESLGARLGAVMEEPPQSTDGRPVHVSVGVAAGTDGSPEDLMRAAGVALETVRARHEIAWQVFDEAKHGEALQRLATEADLRQAVELGEIELAYQPVLSTASGEVVGVEALARWDRPGYGPVPPAVFVPLAERTGLIRQLGRQVLERACQQLQSWRRAHPRASDWTVAVNLSALQLDDPHLVELVTDILRRAGLGHDRLILEVTESALAHDAPGALARLFELRRRGVRLAIDDFGTGYSSLSRLRELPVDILKIDRSFVQTITSRHEPTPILQALFSITRGLGLDVVAEGVESPVQLATLSAHDCDYLQGFLFSRPVPPHELTPLLEADPTWDLEELASDLPAPMSSPELRRLLDELVIAPASRTALDEILRLLAELTGLDSVYLTRLHLRRDVQEILAAANTGPVEIAPGLEVPWSDTLCRRAIADGRRVVADAPSAYPDTDVAERLGIATYVGVEVHGPKGGLRGTLCGVSHHLTSVPPETVETLQWVARLLAEPLIGPERASTG